MPFEGRFGSLSRERRRESVVQAGQVHRQLVRLLLHTGGHDQSFAEVRLRLARSMCLRYEHLPAAELLAA